jgi:agmatine deiminase
MPAEWEKHEATWLGWPHNKTDWPGKFSPIPWVFGEMVRKISPGEIVRIIATGPVQQQAKRVLKRAGGLSFSIIQPIVDGPVILARFS